VGLMAGGMGCTVGRLVARLPAKTAAAVRVPAGVGGPNCGRSDGNGTALNAAAAEAEEVAGSRGTGPMKPLFAVAGTETGCQAEVGTVNGSTIPVAFRLPAGRAKD
jgi:hypothetical protein